MSILARALEPPSYGYLRDGKLYAPTKSEIWREFFSRLNLAANRKNWLPVMGWFFTILFAVPMFVFLTHYFSLKLVAVGLVYSMVLMGTHGTVYLHRYGTHQAYKFSNRFWLFLVRNLVIKVIPEEIYVISHHVHHLRTERPGDPYNVHCGWLYCFLADVNHQLINRNLTEAEYSRLTGLIRHTGIGVNSYRQYVRWGSLCHPLRTFLHYVLNWAFWFAVFFWIGGPALATAIFGFAGVWAFGVRTFNFDGHGRGRDRKRDGVDFNREDWSINQVWPGYVAGEWHNNHHLYPAGARAGFLPYQLDLAWLFIRGCSKVGIVSEYRDFKADFIRDYYAPYLAAQKLKGLSQDDHETVCPIGAEVMGFKDAQP